LTLVDLDFSLSADRRPRTSSHLAFDFLEGAQLTLADDEEYVVVDHYSALLPSVSLFSERKKDKIEQLFE